jgi:predicted dehydrogenase
MTRPRVGLAGAGWIGFHRMLALAESGAVEIVAVADPDAAARERVQKAVPGARLLREFQELTALGLDGVVIATPSAAHAEQCLKAIEAGCAVFCEKPLARTLFESERIVRAARRHDVLLAVDFSYRLTDGMQKLKATLDAGELGDVIGGELVFHNGYGPDKPWFYDGKLSGGGCVMDLGVHLVDALLWLLDFPAVRSVDARLFAEGQRLSPGDDKVEDFALVVLELESGAVFTLSCSWNLSIGADARIVTRLYGTTASVSFQNVGGSFYDFTADRHRGTSTSNLAAPPDEWGGRAIVNWGRALAGGAGYSADADRFLDVARVIDSIYGRSHRTNERARVVGEKAR